MYTCKSCGKKMEDNASMVIVTEAELFNDGEVEYGNTEHYHAQCYELLLKED